MANVWLEKQEHSLALQAAPKDHPSITRSEPVCQLSDQTWHLLHNDKCGYSVTG